MNTFILRWNPTVSSYKMEDHKAVCENRQPNCNCSDWSIHDWKKLKIGDAFVLCQVGTDKDGVAAIGKFISDAYEEDSRCKDGTKKHYADEHFFYNIDRDIETILSAENLAKEFPDIDWHGGHSGILLDSKTADALIARIDLELKNLQDFKNTTFSDFLQNDNRFLPIDPFEKREELLKLFASYNPIVDHYHWVDTFDDYYGYEFIIKKPKPKNAYDYIAIDFVDEDKKISLCFEGWGQTFDMIGREYNICLEKLKNLLENKACILVAMKQKEECAWVFSEKQFTKASGKMSILDEFALRYQDLQKEYPCFHFSEISQINVVYWDSTRSFTIRL